jgi:O-antigen/teichoic acid export membrane protein
VSFDEAVDADVAATELRLGGARLLARAAIGSFGLSIINLAATIVTTILLARLMGVSDFGTFSFVVATVTLFGIPAILGIDRLLIRDIAVYVEKRANALARGLLRRAAQLVLGTSIVLAVAAALVGFLVAGGVISASLLAFWIGVAALPFLALGRVVQAGLMGLHHVVVGQAPEYLLRPVAFLLLVMAVYFVFQSPLDAPLVVLLHGISLAVACGASVALLRALTPSRIGRASPAYETRTWTMSALSLAFLSGAAVVNSQIGVSLLGALSGSESAGLYAVAQRGALLVAFPLAAVNAAIGPTAARLWVSGQHDRLQRLVTLSVRAVVVASLPVAVGFVVLGQQILVFLFGPAFRGADEALGILAIGQLANAATGSVATLLIMTGNQRQAAVGIGMGAVLNIAVAVILIPSLDTVGAASAAAGSLMLSNVALVVVTYRSLGIHSTALGRIRLRDRA